MESTWILYILECKDGSLYTGITDNFPRRLAMHESGKGAKYTRGRGPLVVRYQEVCQSHSNALKREIEVKSFSRKKKLELCAGWKE
jgi:putative endonuclease